ncbi:MAG: energy transducer TonB [Pyrinomonadaceae bacterium]
MLKASHKFVGLALALLVGFTSSAFAQAEDKVDVFTNVVREAPSLCTDLKLGSPIETFKPDYPVEARASRLAGVAKITVLVGADGVVKQVLSSEGPPIFVQPAIAAALRTRFTPSKCDDKAVSVTGLIVFNFVPVTLPDVYTVHSRVAEFSDVPSTSKYFESVLSLTENYRLAFGYADGGFHPDAPLLNGDFAHFLRLTLDYLQKRAEVANKFPREIDLYFPYNRYRFKTSRDFVDLDPAKPYAESLGILVSKYDIALAGADKKARGNVPISLNEVIDLWEKIFGPDAVPVNFEKVDDGDMIMTRGEFALFLDESLNVLTYKVLP